MSRTFAPSDVCVLMLFVLATACGCGREIDKAPAHRQLKEIVLPDMSNAAEPVQAQIRARHASLQQVLARKDAPAMDLAAAFGEFGKLLIAAEYLDVAEASLTNARTLAPDDMRWPYLVGHVRRFKNDPVGAIGFFEQTLALSPNHVPTLVWLADQHLTQGQPGAAEPLLAKARSLDPNSGAILYGLGRAALATQDFPTAVSHLEAALSQRPEATRLHYPLALAYRGLGNKRKAEEQLRLRGEVDLTPHDPLLEEVAGLLQNAAAFETRGSKAIANGDWAEAVTYLRQAVAIAPNNALTRLNLAASLYMQRDTAGALEQYRAALRLSPGLAKAHFGIGVIMQAQGMDREAIEAFDAAVKQDPQYLEARFSLADALRRTGRVADSLTHYEEIVRMNPAVSQASFGYAMGLVRLGRFQEARARLEAAQKTFPEQLGFAHALARLLAAAPDDRVRDGARALAIMNDLMRAQQTTTMAETMAMALAEVRRFDEAVQWQQKALAGATAEKRNDVAQRLMVNLALYRKSQPCRTPWTDDDPVHHPQPAD